MMMHIFIFGLLIVFYKIGLKVMEALGFRYVTNLCWAKNHMGLGQYFRGKHELCLFGVRGKGFSNRTSDRAISSLIEAKKTGHSTKPDAFYELVERRRSNRTLSWICLLESVGYGLGLYGAMKLLVPRTIRFCLR